MIRASLARPALVALAITAGCRIESIDGAAYVGPRNQCELGCPVDSACIDGACGAEKTTYPLVLEVTPPTSSAYAPGVTFSINVAGGNRGERALELPETARVTGKLATASNIPLRLRLERVGAVRGASASVFEAESLARRLDTPPLTIPWGDYYVYVSPAEDSDLAISPPVQLRDDESGAARVVTFTPGNQELQIAYATSFRTLEISLRKDAGEALTEAAEARDLWVLDETTGKLASTIAHTCVTPGDPLKSTVSIALSPALTGHRYTLRVAPAAVACSGSTQVRATIDFDLQALDVEGRGGKVDLAIPAGPTRTRTVLARGLVKAFGTGAPVADADLRLRSTTLHKDVDAKTGRAYVVVDAKTPSDGSFFAELLPGKYRADIIPRSSVTSTSRFYGACIDCTVPSQASMSKPGDRTAEFIIDDTPEFRTGVLAFDIARRVQVTGKATGFDGALFTVGTFEASSSTSETGVNLLGARLLARPETGPLSIVQDKSGRQWNVSPALDPATYDLVLRTSEASGYPWLVRPRLAVPAAGTFDLGTMTATAPVVLFGRVVDTVSKLPIPRATIRARALVTGTDPEQPPLGAVLVAETRADDNGNYRIVVPSSLTVPSPTTTNAGP